MSHAGPNCLHAECLVAEVSGNLENHAASVRAYIVIGSDSMQNTGVGLLLLHEEFHAKQSALQLRWPTATISH